MRQSRLTVFSHPEDLAMTMCSPASPFPPRVFRVSLAGLFALLTVTLAVWTLPGAAQDKKDPKKDDKDKKKEEPKIEKIYPKVEPILEFKGHTDWVNRVCYSPDGKALITSGRDKTIRIWDPASGKEIAKIKDLPANALALAVSPDGGQVATTAGKWNKEKQFWLGEIAIYDIKTGKLTKSIKGHGEPIEAMAFHPDGKKLATASNDGTAKVWNLGDGKELFTLKGHTGPVASIAYSADGKLIATGGDDKTVKLWNADDGKEIKTLKGPARRVGTVAFTKDGKYLAGGSQDGTITIWEVATGKDIHVLKAEEGVLAVAFSADGSKLASGGWEKVVRIWDVKSGKELGGLNGHALPITSVVFSGDGLRVVSASNDQTIRIWEVSAVKQSVDAPKKKDEPKKDEPKKK
jgi:eukaryotic-like serine/threonine-protein kinase